MGLATLAAVAGRRDAVLMGQRRLDPRVARCMYCGLAIGTYEPIVVLEEDGPRHTSLAAELGASHDHGERYHRACYAAAFAPPLALLSPCPGKGAADASSAGDR